jgi:hypothetical protein
LDWTGLDWTKQEQSTLGKAQGKQAKSRQAGQAPVHMLGHEEMTINPQVLTMGICHLTHMSTWLSYFCFFPFICSTLNVVTTSEYVPGDRSAQHSTCAIQYEHETRLQ